MVTRVQLATLHWVTVGTTVTAGTAGFTAEALVRFQGNPCGICDRQRVCWNTVFLTYLDFAVSIATPPLLNVHSFISGARRMGLEGQSHGTSEVQTRNKKPEC